MNPYDENRDRSAPAAPPAEGQPSQPMVRVQMPESAPYVTYVIIAITVVAYVLQMASESLLGTDILILYGARINEAILAGELWRFLTPALLHGSIPHILFNMYALFSFGTGLERHFGHGRFLLLYVLCAFTGNV
ncbi:MAG TPA: rhomboid family intramembrane serine protease, partial [Anaerolineales bacterium]|nr:rhomboid family intramembrane serine protease [Anaerolineales bacterium]